MKVGLNALECASIARVFPRMLGRFPDRKTRRYVTQVAERFKAQPGGPVKISKKAALTIIDLSKQLVEEADTMLKNVEGRSILERIRFRKELKEITGTANMVRSTFSGIIEKVELELNATEKVKAFKQQSG